MCVNIKKMTERKGRFGWKGLVALTMISGALVFCGVVGCASTYTALPDNIREVMRDKTPRILYPINWRWEMDKEEKQGISKYKNKSDYKDPREKIIRDREETRKRLDATPN